MQTILTLSQLNNDAKQEINVAIINNIKISTSTFKSNSAIVKSIVDHSFAKKIVFEKKSLALIKEIYN